MTASGWAFSSTYRDAASRRTQLEWEAGAHSITPEHLDTASLMRMYQQFGGDPDVFAWRFTSGVLHTQEWAALMSQIERLGGRVTIGEFKSTANQTTAIRMTTAATSHFEAALGDYASYVEPWSP